MASALRSLKIQAGIAVAVAFCAGVAAAGALSYDAMSRTLDQAHRNALGAAAKDGLSTLAAVRNRMKVYSDVMSRHPEMVAAVDKRDPGQLEAVTVREFKAMHALDPSLASLETRPQPGETRRRQVCPAASALGACGQGRGRLDRVADQRRSRRGQRHAHSAG